MTKLDKNISKDTFFEVELRDSDLIIDNVYKGGRKGNAGDDPLSKLIGVSNQGGFRYLGNKKNPNLIVLTSSMNDPDWPDNLDTATGVFTYYGDNKRNGRKLHDTPRFGNILLRDLFTKAHGGKESRVHVPPILIFASVKPYRDVKFLGLAVPGTVGSPQTEDLVAVWKSTAGKRFQNYKAQFSILDEAVISSAWVKSIKDGSPNPGLEPENFKVWKKTGIVRPLIAERSLEHRSKDEQLPNTKKNWKLIETITNYFSEDHIRFEACAAHIADMELGQTTNMTVTRGSRDGGRDAIGKFQLGQSENGIFIDFSLEAKCYSKSNSVGVRELSRLISRLRHRQFGILVTTSYVGDQAYKEIKEDKHPIIIITALDIVRILERNGYGNVSDLEEWLSQF